jgi:hypothetical protein
MSKALLILFFLMIGFTVFFMSEMKDEAFTNLHQNSPISVKNEISA